MTDRELMSIAKKASMNAYVPYSGYAVGAALLTAYHNAGGDIALSDALMEMLRLSLIHI